MLLAYEKQTNRDAIYISDTDTDFVYLLDLDGSHTFSAACQQIMQGERLDTLAAFWVETVEADFGNALLADYEDNHPTLYALPEEMTAQQQAFFEVCSDCP
jgi:hypothetical protein